MVIWNLEHKFIFTTHFLFSFRDDTMKKTTFQDYNRRFHKHKDLNLFTVPEILQFTEPPHPHAHLYTTIFTPHSTGHATCHPRWQGKSGTRKEIPLDLIRRWQVLLDMTCLFPGLTPAALPGCPLHGRLHWVRSKEEDPKKHIILWGQGPPGDPLKALETLQWMSSVHTRDVSKWHSVGQSRAVKLGSAA